MNYWLVYHSYAKMKYLPGFWDDDDLNWDVKSQALSDFTKCSNRERAAVLTRRAGIMNAVGDVAFLIVGIKELRQSFTSYYLWNWILLDTVAADEDGYVGSGEVWHGFRPPIRLEGDEFDSFKQSTANFAQGMVNISSKPFCQNVLVDAFDKTRSGL